MSHLIYLITGEPCDNENKFLELLKISLEQGIKLVQIRAKLLDYNQYQNLASKAIKLCREYQATVLLNTHLNLIDEIGADGVHLPSKNLMELNERPIPKHRILSVACHNEEEVIHASKIGADFAVICPVLATPSSPEKKPLGWEKFSDLVKLAHMPIYALGSVTPKDIEKAKSYGAIGIAAIRSIWGKQILNI